MRILALVALVAFAACSHDDRAPSPALPSQTPVGKPMMAEVPANLEIAVLAGGCFWGMEGILRKIPGVIDTEAGYASGAESVRIVFDPAKVTYQTLLDRWFFRMHDPTTKNRQGNDVGSQYRSVIFYTSDAQRVVAERSKITAGTNGRWKDPIVTEIAALESFKPGEDFHQDFLEKNPDGYTCHYIRD